MYVIGHVIDLKFCEFICCCEGHISYFVQPRTSSRAKLCLSAASWVSMKDSSCYLLEQREKL